jgi:hypothetical protein
MIDTTSSDDSYAQVEHDAGTPHREVVHVRNRNIVHEEKLAPRILSVAKFLADHSLVIPPYQRPYKWTTKNVVQLFDDIATFKTKQTYRLGTIVFHEDGGLRNIVDGQQRTITLLLAVRALIREKLQSLDRKDLRDQLVSLEGSIFQPNFTSEVSIFNIHTNYREVVRIVSRADFTEDMIDFLLNKCEVVTFGLGDLSEAFQFFDSQNARGRDLEPHDLLKAYHLREFDTSDERAKAATVADWENCETQELAGLFAEYLFRIRNWSRGASARYFGKKDTPLFKGIHLGRVSRYPYVESLRIAHHFVDHYNGQYERRIVGDQLPFPFQLDQTIINGSRFFEMIAHYRMKVSGIAKASHRLGTLAPGTSLERQAEEIMQVINRYPGKNRDGDLYVRGIFDCLLIYYLDKFGDAEVSRAVEKIFIWAYTIRMRMQVVQLATVDNYVLSTGVFQRIKEATEPRDFLQLPLPAISVNQSSKTGEIQEIFKKMGYHHE